MEDNKDQVLADFQSCTGMEDVAECFMHLEEANWNLLDAINRVMPQETQTLPSEHSPAGTSSLPIPNSSSITDDVTPLLDIFVRYRGKTVPLKIPPSETVGAVKSALFSELGVPPCRQEIHGWKKNHITDETVLSSLEMPADNTLYLATPEIPEPSHGDSFHSDLNRLIKLNIHDDTNKKSYSINFPGTKTILEIKQDICDLTGIQVRHQRWFGWPETVPGDSVSLASVSENSNILNLRVKKEQYSPKKSQKHQVVDLVSSDSSPDEFEDASECLSVDDDMFQSDVSSQRLHPLMPDDVEDETAAISHFTNEFARRYGPCHPVFFQGTLSEALQASCQKPCQERKPLVVYLHHDASVLTNVFCTQLLCSETIVSYLTLNFITWVWDLTFESNRFRFLTTVMNTLGIAASNTIRNISVDHLPALMVITRVRSTTEVLTVIPGSVSLDELMTRLVHAVEVFNSELSTEAQEEADREAREQVKREQDAAYEASLLADRAKEEAKKIEEEARVQKEKELLQEKEKQEEQRLQEQERKRVFQQTLAIQVPPEPSEDGPEPVSHIRARLPSGQVLSRKFMAKWPLKTLLLFLASKGYSSKEYKVLSSWPRRDLSSVDENQTLEQLSLFPKETLTLEER